MAGNQDKIADLQNRIVKEQKIIAGFQAMRSATANQDTIRSCESKIRDGERNIRFFQESIRELQGSRPSPGGPGGAGGGGGGPIAVGGNGIRPDGGYRRGGHGQWSDAEHAGPQQGKYAGQIAPPANGPGLRKETYTNLDLCKYDTPLTGAKINRMLVLLEYKYEVELGIKKGVEKMVKLYQADGDKKSRLEAESKRLESNQKIQLLQQAMKRYKGLEVIGIDDDDAGAQERSGVHRRPLTGALQITIKGAKELDHAPLPKRGKAISESVVVMKVEDMPRARTRPSRNDRWDEEFEIHVDKAQEIEIAIYDKITNEAPIPIGMAWIRLADVVEELRRKKVGNDSGPGWVTAARVSGRGESAGENVPIGVASPTMGGAGGMGGGFGHDLEGGQMGMPGGEGVEAWFNIEPAGAIGLQLNFVKSNVRKRPYDTGGLGRQGAVRKKKEEVHEQNGHKFIAQQFYGVYKCALCGEFLGNASGMQCEDCKYLCHKKCYTRVVTKCISKSNADATDLDEDKMLNHRIPHRFEPFANVGPNWCCHCGILLPFGRKNARRCSECDITTHADCAHLVPDFCGMTMEMANRLLQEIKTAKVRQAGRFGAGAPKQDQLPTPARPQVPSQPSWAPSPQQQQSPHRVPPPMPQSSSYDSLSSGVGRMQVGGPQQDAYRRPPHQDGQPLSAPPTPQKDHRYAAQPPPQHQRVPSSAPSLPMPDQESVVGSIFGDYAASPPASRPPSVGATPAAVRPLPQQPPQPLPHAPQQQQPSRLPPGAQPPHVQGRYDPRFPQQHQQQQQQPPDPRQSYHLPTSVSQQSIPSAAQQQQVGPPAAVAPSPQTLSTKPSKPRKVGLDDFNFLAVLGKGNFGKVMLAEEKRSQHLYAIKVLKKDFIIENDEVESTKSEKRVFMTASRERHPFLIGLHSCFQTETRIYFVMEYVSGGDLMLHIQREQFTPRRAKFYAAEVLLALEYFHKNGIVYRDLKLDNILLTLDGHVKVADYGLCKEDMWYQSTTSTFCGTPEFMAPEILLEQRYGRAVDWWAFGVLIYEMLLGQSPFKGDDEEEIFDAILEDEPLYPIHMPRDSVQILQRLLTREPHRRLGSGPTDADEIRAHPFFRDMAWADVYHKRIPAPYFPTVNGQTDVSNFDSEFTKESPRLTPVHSKLRPEDQREFEGFSWTAAWAN